MSSDYNFRPRTILQEEPVSPDVRKTIEGEAIYEHTHEEIDLGEEELHSKPSGPWTWDEQHELLLRVIDFLGNGKPVQWSRMEEFNLLPSGRSHTQCSIEYRRMRRKYHPKRGQLLFARPWSPPRQNHGRRKSNSSRDIVDETQSTKRMHERPDAGKGKPSAEIIYVDSDEENVVSGTTEKVDMENSLHLPKRVRTRKTLENSKQVATMKNNSEPENDVAGSSKKKQATAISSASQLPRMPLMEAGPSFHNPGVLKSAQAGKQAIRSHKRSRLKVAGHEQSKEVEELAVAAKLEDELATSDPRPPTCEPVRVSPISDFHQSFEEWLRCPENIPIEEVLREL